MVNRKFPIALGVPDTLPVELIARPPGNDPPPMVQLYGGTPPFAVGLTGAYAKPSSPAWKATDAIASDAGGDGDGEGELSALGEVGGSELGDASFCGAAPPSIRRRR